MESPSNKFSEDKNNGSQKHSDITSRSGLDEILSNSLYNTSNQPDTDLTSSFTGDIKFDTDPDLIKKEKLKKKEVKSKKELEEEEREKMQ